MSQPFPAFLPTFLGLSAEEFLLAYVFAQDAVVVMPSTDWINVTSSPYNATGDGSTDDTAAIDAAIRAGFGYTSAGTATVVASTDTFTLTSHGLTNGTRIALTSSTATGAVNDTFYYVIGATTNTFQLSGSSGGSTINITADGTAVVNRLAAHYSAVFFPAGKYKRTTPILLRDGLTLIGSGGAEKEFDRRSLISNNSSHMFAFGGLGATGTGTVERVRDIHLQGLAFSSNNTTFDFIEPAATNASGAYPSYLDVQFCGIHGFRGIYNGPVLCNRWHHNYINNYSTEWYIGGSDSHFHHNYIDGYINSTTSAMVRFAAQNSTFSENYVTCSPAIGIRVDSWSIGQRVVNNVFNGLCQSASHGGNQYTSGPAIYVAAGARGAMICHNGIGNNVVAPSGNFDCAIVVVDASDITIQNNVIDSLQSASPGAGHIRITQSAGTVDTIKVSGNTYTTGQSTHDDPVIKRSGTTTNLVIDDWDTAAKRLASDATFTSNVTLANLSGMSVAVAASGIAEVWNFEGEVYVDGDVTGDVKLAVTVPSGSTLAWAPIGLQSAAAGAQDTANFGMTQTSGTGATLGLVSGTRTVILIRGTVTTSTTAGNIQVQAAQGTSSANTTTVRAGSWIRGHRVS